jgi:hypothetical protein
MHAPMSYVDPPDVPEGMTLLEYRRRTRRPIRRPGVLTRLRRRVARRRPAEAGGRAPDPPA